MKGFKLENRKAHVAGSFYKGNAVGLKAELQDLFAEAEFSAANTAKPQAIIAPHAGYVFSGKIAAAAYLQIPKGANYKRVFVLASSHQFHFNGAAVYTQGNYETPLGEIEVDRELGKELMTGSDLFREKSEAHNEEHSLEVQLPFLQYKLGNSFKLVPLILGTNNADDCKNIAQVLKPYFSSENLFVISTDFSHYPEYANAVEVDELTANAICNNQPELLLSTLKQNKTLLFDNLATSLCGWTSILTLLYLSENRPFEYNKVAYQNSGDAKYYGDKNRVVGYWAISVFEREKEWTITKDEKSELIEKAQNSIVNYLKKGEKSKIYPPRTSGILHQKAGAFVSVYINQELRGCIGGFAGNKSLNHVVQEMAVASVCDGRFDKVSDQEAENVQIEISILSPLKQIKSIDEIELGKHGIYIKSNYNTGTFLPQVAKKMNWNKEEFLGHCARDKARIGWDGWKTAELYTYEAIVIRDF